MVNESEYPGLEERMAKIEGILEQMNARLNHLEGEVRGLRAELHTDVRWIIGFVVGTWITLMLTLLFRPR